MKFPAHIFKAYDIRGLVGTELSSEFAYALGRAFVVFLRGIVQDLNEKNIVVGYDMRPSSQDYYREVIRGITDEGVNAVNIGMTSTPVFNFTCAHVEGHAGGIMVTASHNPAEWNGFKLAFGDGLPIGLGNGGSEIQKIMEAGEWNVAGIKGSEKSFNAFELYIQHIFALVSKETLRPFKVVVDFGNGMGSVVLPKIIKELSLEVVYLYDTPDGTFPNHEANPLKVDTLHDLQKKVLEVGADFGFALDGDADRIGLVDEKGNVVEASYVGALLGNEVLRVHGGGKMLYDLRSSMKVAEFWREAGAEPVMSRVGRAFIVGEMKRLGAIFGSELSLHLFYQDMHDLESSDLSFLYVLQLLSREGKSLSVLVESLKTYFHSGEINFEVHDTDGTLVRVEEFYKSQAQEITHLDGVLLTFDWGWINLRKSNTEPVVRLNLEAKSKEKMESMLEEVKQIIEK
jgi:phosphomannomutase